jgi:predicted MFS family arabinose efflux permease
VSVAGTLVRPLLAFLRWPVRPLPGREGEARRLAVLLFGEGLSANMLRPIVPLLATAIGAGPAVAGTLLAAQELTAAFVRIPAAVTSVAFGRRQLLLWCFASGAVTCAIFAVAPAVGMLFLAQALWGASTASFWPVQWAYLTTLMPPGHYAKVMGYGLGISGVGLVLGPIVAGALADLWGLRLPFIVVGAWMLVALGMIWTLPAAERAAGGHLWAEMVHSTRRAFRLVRSMPVLASCAGSFLTQAADGVATVLIPLHLHAAGYPIAFIGAVVTTRKVMTVATRFLFSALAQRLGLVGVVGLGLILDLIGLAGLVWIEGWIGVLVAAFISGLGGGAGEPAAKTLVVQRTSGEERELGLSVEGTALVLGRAAGAAGIGVLIAALGAVSATIAACVAIAAAGAAVVWWWALLHRPAARPAAAQ